MNIGPILEMLSETGNFEYKTDEFELYSIAIKKMNIHKFKGKSTWIRERVQEEKNSKRIYMCFGKSTCLYNIIILSTYMVYVHLCGIDVVQMVKILKRCAYGLVSKLLQ